MLFSFTLVEVRDLVDEGLALFSLVELSTDCTTVSSAVDSPTAGAAISPLKVHVVSALDPEVIVAIAK